jgi:hypothetical protein
MSQEFPIIKDFNEFVENNDTIKYTTERLTGTQAQVKTERIGFDKLDFDFDNPRKVLIGDTVKRTTKPPLKDNSRKIIKSNFNKAIRLYRQNWYDNVYQKYPRGKKIVKGGVSVPNTRLGNAYGLVVKQEDTPDMIRGLEEIASLLNIVKSDDFVEFLKLTFKNENTLRNYYSSMIYFLEQVRKEDRPANTQRKFTRLRQEINESQLEKQGKLTDRQKQNAIPQEKLQKEITEKLNPLIAQIESIEDKDDEEITSKDLTVYKYYLLLITYTALPMRNELATIRSGLYSEYEEQTKRDKSDAKKKGKKFSEGEIDRPYLEGNWLLLDGNKSYLLFNRYKTDGKYGARLIELPADITRVYNRYLVLTDNQKGQPIFGLTNNALSTFMGRQSLKYFGKRITPNLLRTIYYSGKYQPQSFRSFTEMSNALREDGKTQGTSVPTLIRNYIKDIGKDDKVLKNEPKPTKTYKKTLRGKKPKGFKPVQTLEEAIEQDLVEEKI